MNDHIHHLHDGVWPEEPPNVPAHMHGWLAPGTARMLERHLDETIGLVLELGAWLGKSAQYILDHAPNTHLLSVDLWDDKMIRPWIRRRHPHLMPVVEAGVQATYMVNLWEYRDRLTPLKMHSHKAIQMLVARGIQPDVVFLDTSHGYNETLREVALVTKAFPNAILVGDDWQWETGRSAKRSGPDWGHPVARAVTDFVARDPRWEVESDENGWVLRLR